MKIRNTLKDIFASTKQKKVIVEEFTYIPEEDDYIFSGIYGVKNNFELINIDGDTYSLDLNYFALEKYVCKEDTVYHKKGETCIVGYIR